MALHLLRRMNLQVRVLIWSFPEDQESQKVHIPRAFSQKHIISDVYSRFGPNGKAQIRIKMAPLRSFTFPLSHSLSTAQSHQPHYWQSVYRCVCVHKYVCDFCDRRALNLTVALCVCISSIKDPQQSAWPVVMRAQWPGRNMWPHDACSGTLWQCWETV